MSPVVVAEWELVGEAFGGDLRAYRLDVASDVEPKWKIIAGPDLTVAYIGHMYELMVATWQVYIERRLNN